MIGFSVFRLDFSAVLTNFKALAYFFNTGNRQFFTDHVTFTKVNFSQSCFANKLISKREIFVVHTICTGNIVIFIYINQKLFTIEYIISIIALIVNQALGIIHVRVDHLNLQHCSNLSGISPGRTTTLRASRRILAGFFNLSMRTIRAKSPSCSLSSSQINLIYGQLATVNIKAVIRSKLADSRGCTTTIFIDQFLIFFLFN